MSLRENIDKHWPEIERKRAALQESLSWSASGRNLSKMAEFLNSSGQMKAVKVSLANGDGNPIDRFKMTEYLAQVLENEPNYNMDKFLQYLDLIAANAACERRAGYYENLRSALLQLKDSKELHLYLQVYEHFKRDHEKEARLAKQVMDKMSEDTQHIMGEYS